LFPLLPRLTLIHSSPAIGQDVEKPAEKNGTAVEEDQVDDNVKSPKKKKVKKAKLQKMINRQNATVAARASNRARLQHNRL
jgi:hypothetical protein